ncbi:transcriptional regulator, AraC family [Emticicia oligotrophica DSM 17448]|uniref:Transcriptional regulator, AraC family n=1 Tax=Emticicia oligotrophica (strain DSM 17448 / CIP 109782 / MTCC 6937 / GPTSA100-15) TaxID=929562 RepID=A0ABM5N548_EMTOG|nr:helix-turn-helix domain-containing protein [Emticicia oligotrophica]AFK04574.1 transcriptional regulator, AraC family [Emticicia oligotrophica DSM 17448]
MKQEKSILNFEGLYGDDYGRYSSEYIFLELIATRSQLFNWTIKPHIHSQLFQLFIVRKGSLLFQEATQEHQLQAPCITLIPPTKLHGLVYNPDVEGYILTLSESIIDEIFKTSSVVWKTLEDIRILNHFEDKTFDKIQKNLANIEFELFGENPERYLMLRAYLTELFISLHRLTKQEEAQQNDSMTMAHFRKFQLLIKQANYPKSIPEFADELNISSVHLNRICNAVSGKSAIELVHQNIINEAQKYLLHTSYSVSEIAYMLKFEYPNYFAKLFKKHTGVSPLEFRKMDRK